MFLTVPSRTPSGDTLPLTPPLEWYIPSPALPSADVSTEHAQPSMATLAMTPASVAIPTIEKDDIVKTEIMSRPDKNNFCTLKFPVQHRARGTRASVPKVRTGCITCKRRHLKCDEDKPGCSRCMRWQGYCEGYEVLLPKKSPARPPSSGSISQTTPGKIAKRASSANKHSRSNSSVSSTASASCLPSPATPSFSTITTPAPSPREDPILPVPYTTTTTTNSSILPTPCTASFVAPVVATPSPPLTSLHPLDAWLLRVSTLSAHLTTHPFWHSALPNLSATNRGISLAVHAVATMTHAKAACDPSAHESALEHYGSALAEIACSPSAGAANLRSAVLCCLLFASFESMHGDKTAALAHVHNGMRMLDELSRLSQEWQAGAEDDKLDSELVVLFYAFSPDIGADVLGY